MTENAKTESKLHKTENVKKYMLHSWVDKDGSRYFIRPQVRYDDTCNNGHNDFAITADIYDSGMNWVAGGCQHEMIAKHCPKLKYLIKWHLCSSEEPMYYIENSIYWWKKHEYKNFRSTAIWPNVSSKYLDEVSESKLRIALLNRKPALMKRFRKTIEGLGFEF